MAVTTTSCCASCRWPACRCSSGCQLDEITPGTIVCVARNAWADVVPTAEESMLGVLRRRMGQRGLGVGRAGRFQQHRPVVLRRGAVRLRRRWSADRGTSPSARRVSTASGSSSSTSRTCEAFRAEPAGGVDRQARQSTSSCPSVVWRGGWGVKRAFLHGLLRGRRRPTRVAATASPIHYTTYSERLGRELQELLAEFGVIATRKRYTRPSGAIEHRLIISGLRNVKAFAERIGFLATKQAKLARAHPSRTR